METPVPSLPRRDFFKASAAGFAAVVAVGPSPLASVLQASEPSAARKSIGIQVGAVSFVDEGTEKVLDLLQERGAIGSRYAGSRRCRCRTGSGAEMKANRLRSHPVGTSVSREAGWRRERDQEGQRSGQNEPRCHTKEIMRSGVAPIRQPAYHSAET